MNKKEYERIEKIGNVKVFGTELNVYGTFDEPWFMAKEVAEWIDYSTYVNKEKGIRNISKMLKPIDEDYKEKFEIICDIPESNITSSSSSKARKTQVMLFISEDGLYDLLSTSRNKKAKKFKKEVRKILKKIRKFNKQLVFNDDSIFINTMISEKKKQNKEKSMLKSAIDVCKKISKRSDLVCPFNTYAIEYLGITKEEFENFLYDQGILNSDMFPKKKYIKDGYFTYVEEDFPIINIYCHPVLTLTGMVFVKMLMDMENYIDDFDYDKYIEKLKKIHHVRVSKIKE